MKNLPHLVLVAALCAWLPASAQFNDKWASFEAAPGALPTGATLSDDDHETDLAWADLDLDGDMDLVVVRKQPFTTLGMRTNVLLMNEAGVLVDRSSSLAVASSVPGDMGFLTPTNDRDVVIADLTGDGYPEVITAVEQTVGQKPSVFNPRIYLNLGVVGGVWQGLRFEDSRFPTLFHMTNGKRLEPRFTTVAAGDLNGDGFTDLYFGDHDTTLFLFTALQPAAEDTDDRLLLNDGNGFFTDATSLMLTPAMARSYFCNSVELVDINQDGSLDIVKQVTYENPQLLSIAYNDPANPGTITKHVTTPLTAPYFMNTGDLNQDGRLDLAMTSNSFDTYIFNTGNGPDGTVNWSTPEPVQFLVGAEPKGAFNFSYSSNNLIVDIDGDGWDDLLIADVDVEIPQYNDEFRLHFYHNRGGVVGSTDIDLVEERESPVDGGWVGAHGLLPIDLRWTHDVAAFDVNSDGLQDLVLSRREGTQVWLQTAPPLCQTDLGFGGELVLELCGGDLSTGSSAVLKVLGGVPASPLFLVIGTAANPTPIAGLGVTLVPDPMLLLLTLGTDSMGQLTSVIPGGGGPISLFAQAFQAPIVGPDWFSSNAIEAKFLP